MKDKEKAKELFNKYHLLVNDFTKGVSINELAKQCALIAIENEYHSLREMLFNLSSCRVIESEKVYLYRLSQLIDEEQQIKQEIINL